jgi:hypothetical protein
MGVEELVKVAFELAELTGAARSWSTSQDSR